MTKDHYVIRNSKTNKLLTWGEDGRILMFENTTQAFNYIYKKCGDSPYLKVEKFTTGHSGQP